MISIKLTLAATRSEPADVAVALLRGRGRTAIVDARALNTAVGVVEALLLKFAPCTVIESIASATTQQVAAVTAAVLSVDLPLDYIDVGARPKSVARPPFLGFSQQSNCAIGTGEILGQLNGVLLSRGIVLDEFAVTGHGGQVHQRPVESVQYLKSESTSMRVGEVPRHVEAASRQQGSLNVSARHATRSRRSGIVQEIQIVLPRSRKSQGNVTLHHSQRYHR